MRAYGQTMTLASSPPKCWPSASPAVPSSPLPSSAAATRDSRRARTMAMANRAQPTLIGASHSRSAHENWASTTRVPRPTRTSPASPNVPTAPPCRAQSPSNATTSSASASRVAKLPARYQLLLQVAIVHRSASSSSMPSSSRSGQAMAASPVLRVKVVGTASPRFLASASARVTSLGDPKAFRVRASAACASSPPWRWPAAASRKWSSTSARMSSASGALPRLRRSVTR
jgi:hypothetical protein